MLIAESIRDEHRTALGWLNDNARDDGTIFFGIEVAAWRIGDSAPAPQLRVAVEPDDWRRAVRTTSDITGRGAAYASFWAGLLPLLHEAEPRWRGTKTPRPEGMLSFKSAIPSVRYLPRFGRSGLNIQAYIDSGDAESTREIYDWLHDARRHRAGVWSRPCVASIHRQPTRRVHRSLRPSRRPSRRHRHMARTMGMDHAHHGAARRRHRPSPALAGRRWTPRRR